jgi:RimJ/RimL family protein N-acetyltransferase
MLETVPLRTARLRLRPPRPEDAAALAVLMTPRVSRWLGTWPVPFTAGMAEARIARSLAATAAGHAFVCVVEHREEFAGWIGGGRIEGTDCGEFGFWLGEPWHGRAFMQEAAPAFVAAFRPRLALDSIEAACQPENGGSARVLAACGLKRVGTRMYFASARGREERVDVWERAWTREAPG